MTEASGETQQATGSGAQGRTRWWAKGGRRARWMSGALGAVIVADLIVAATGGGSASAAAGSEAHRPAVTAAQRLATAQYERGVRSVATDVYLAISPIQKALNTTITPSVVTVIAARDAVAHSDAPAQLAAASSKLSKLSAPAADAHLQDSLVAALASLRRAVVGISGSKNAMADDFTSDVSTRLVTPEERWDTATSAAFRHLRLGRAIRVDRAHYGKLPASRSSWIYGVDTACFSQSKTLKPVGPLNDAIKAHNASTTQLEEYNSIWSRVFGSISSRVRKLPKPGGIQRLPLQLNEHLKVLGFTSAVFGRLERDVEDQDQTAFTNDNATLVNTFGSQRTLATELKSYGAVGCSDLLLDWQGKGPSTTSATNGPDKA